MHARVVMPMVASSFKKEPAHCVGLVSQAALDGARQELKLSSLEHQKETSQLLMQLQQQEDAIAGTHRQMATMQELRSADQRSLQQQQTEV